jgi:hypothetical protein
MEEFLQDFSVELSEVENRRLAAYSAGVRNMQMQMGTRTVLAEATENSALHDGTLIRIQVSGNA